MLFDQNAQLLCRLLGFFLRRSGINHSGVEYPSGGIDHRDLATGAVGRIQSEHRLSLERRLHQKRLEVQSKNLDGLFGRVLRERGTQLPLQRGKEQPRPAVGRRRFHYLNRWGKAPFEHQLSDFGQRRFVVALHRNLQDVFPLAAVKRQHTIPCNFADRLGKVVIHRVDARLGLIARRADDAGAAQPFAQPPTHRRII